MDRDSDQFGAETNALPAALADPAWHTAKLKAISQLGLTVHILDQRGGELGSFDASTRSEWASLRPFLSDGVEAGQVFRVGPSEADGSSTYAAALTCGDQKRILCVSSTAGVDEPVLQAVCGVLSVVFEVIFQRHLEMAAHRTLMEEQKAIIDHIGDGLLVLAYGGVVRHVNTIAGRILGIDPRTAVGKRLADLIDFEPVIGPVFISGSGYVDRELIIDSPARHLHLLDTAIPIMNSCGRVVSVVNTFREFKRVRKLVGKYAGNHARYTFDNVIGASASLLDAVASAKRAAKGSANLLLSGESGVGKEVFAQAIHNESERHGHPFIAINCAALPHDLIESELFGHAPGSFTGATRDGRPGKFESADGGTVFLDEISELPVDVQAKLLRVLQEKEVTRLGDTRGIQIDVRIICASNRNLSAMVQEKRFREDLYYRCNVIDITIPPLRQRSSDIPILIDYFVSKYSTLLGKRISGFGPRALQKMSGYAWPGNVRQLENFIERLVNLSEEHFVADIADFVPDGASDALYGSAAHACAAKEDTVLSLARAERQAIEVALRCCSYNVTRCASMLDISKPGLYAKVKRHGIRLER